MPCKYNDSTAMIITADSGSTSIDWRILRRDEPVRRLVSPGVNPVLQKVEAMRGVFAEALKGVEGPGIRVYFYGCCLRIWKLLCGRSSRNSTIRRWSAGCMEGRCPRGTWLRSPFSWGGGRIVHMSEVWWQMGSVFFWSAMCCATAVLTCLLRRSDRWHAHTETSYGRLRRSVVCAGC